ncbi:MAG: universal stress protein [Bacteroidetes bacterium]|nr:universal stress protein [Bacteroidota bacterium]
MSTKTGQIIVPIDFGEQSLLALSQSYNLARLTKSEITLLNVIDEDFLKPFQDVISAKHNYEGQLRDDIKLRLGELALKVQSESGIRVNVMTKVGKIYDEIVNAAREIDATLILMGTMGVVGLKKRILGSNASRVVREAECPVITIKGKEHRFGIKHILLPLDLSKETKEKVDKAIELAQMFGSIIHVVTIVENEDEFLMNKLIRQMNQVVAFIEEGGLTCTSEFVSGSDVAEEVLNTAKKVKADLIMIMTQQEVGFTDLFISSAAQEIINNSDIPVLSIRPFPKKDTTVSILS